MDNVDRSLAIRRRERAKKSEGGFIPASWSAFLFLKEESSPLRYRLILESPSIEDLLVDISMDDPSVIEEVTADTTAYDKGWLIFDIAVKKKIDNHHIVLYPDENLITCIFYTTSFNMEQEEDDPPLYCEWEDGVLHSC